MTKSAAQFAAKIIDEIAKARRRAGKVDLANSADKMSKVLRREDRQRRQMERAILKATSVKIAAGSHLNDIFEIARRLRKEAK